MAASTDSKLDAILEAIKSLEERITRIEHSNSHARGGEKAAAPTSSKKLSIKEFLLERPPTTDIQRTLSVDDLCINRL